MADGSGLGKIKFVKNEKKKNKSPCNKINTHLLQGSDVCERKMK